MNVEKAWENLEAKHDEYVVSAVNVSDEDHDVWMSACHEEIYEIRKLYFERKESIETANEVANSKRARDVKYDHLLSLYKNIESSVKIKIISEYEMKIVNKCFEEVVLLHKELSCKQGYNENVVDWLRDLTSLHHRTCSLVENNEILKNSIQLQKLPLPTFDGNIQRYARFSSDFLELVCPTLKGKEACFALRQCLTPEVSRIIDNLSYIHLLKKLVEHILLMQRVKYLTQLFSSIIIVTTRQENGKST